MHMSQFTTKEIKVAQFDIEIEEMGLELPKLYSQLGVVVRRQK